MISFENAKWVEWIEPFGPNNEPVYCRVRPDVAISTAKHAALSADSKYEYKRDQDAFEDFVVVHWARIIPKPAPLEPNNK